MQNSLKEKFKKMHPNDRETIMEQASAMKEQLAIIQSGDVEAAGNLDSGVLRRQLAQKEKILDNDDRLVARGAEKDRLAKEAREIEERIKPNMCSRNELWYKSGTMDSEKAVLKQMAFERNHGRDAARLQEIRSRLEPDDPMNCSLERIRPER